LFDAGNEGRNTIIKSMQGTAKSSAGYKRGEKTHFPSKPGHPPAIDSGDLIGSIFPEVGDMKLELGSIIQDPDYPKFLEEGTPRMDARPWLDPAWSEIEPGLIEDMGKVIPDIVDRIFRGAEK